MRIAVVGVGGVGGYFGGRLMQAGEEVIFSCPWGALARAARPWTARGEYQRGLHNPSSAGDG